MIENENETGNENENEIKPSGMMKVAQKIQEPGGKPKIASKRKLYTKFRKLIAAVPAAAIIAAAALVIYSGTGNAKKSEEQDPASAPEPAAEAAAVNMGYFGAAGNNINGWWILTDYVEDTRDFIPDGFIYKNYGVKLYSSSFEFFEDRTVLVKLPNGEVISRRWGINGEIINISAISVILTDEIIVCDIKNIENADYMFISGNLPEVSADIEIPGYYVLKRGRERHLYAGDDVRDKDLRNYDLSDIGPGIYNIIFSEKTRFPASGAKRPENGAAEYQPEYIIEQGKNPGLGVRRLHEAGITGEGVSIAIIDEPLARGHPEYKNKIAGYKDFAGGAEPGERGAAIASLLAGENIGTAPGVKIYYAAVPAWNSYDAEYYAKALDWVVEINEGLPEGEKIRAACITPNPENPEPWINVHKYLESFKRATEAGILVLDCTNEHGVVVGACRYDFNDPEDVALCVPVKAYRIFIAPDHYDNNKADEIEDIFNSDESRADMIRAPVRYRTTAVTDGAGGFSYQYDGIGELSRALPYITGALAMGWQLRPELTPDEMIKILFETAYTGGNADKFIYPAAFIEYLKK